MAVRFKVADQPSTGVHCGLRVAPLSVEPGHIVRAAVSTDPCKSVKDQSSRVASDSVESTWETPDLQVLRAIVERTDETGQSVEPWWISMDTGIDHLAVKRAVRRLASESPPFFAYDTNAFDEIWLVGNPTGHARRAVGQWPSPESLTDRLIASLREAAEAEPDPEKNSRLRQLAEGLAGIGREVLVKAATRVLTEGL
jgi:hypothetical protein